MGLRDGVTVEQDVRLIQEPVPVTEVPGPPEFDAERAGVSCLQDWGLFYA